MNFDLLAPCKLPSFDSFNFYEVFKSYAAEMNITIFRLIPLIQTFERQKAQVLAHVVDGKIVAFLLFSVDTLESGFFSKKIIFLRELWTHPALRHKGMASSLMQAAELYAHEQDINMLLLTAPNTCSMYRALGYSQDSSILSENKLPVFVKYL